ncbi:hypothetical protein ACH4CE_36625 [Streptomyces gelaticus]
MCNRFAQEAISVDRGDQLDNTVAFARRHAGQCEVLPTMKL